MKKLFTSFLLILMCVGLVYGEALVPFNFPFTGRWNASENPLLLDEYGIQDIQNLRKSGKHFRGVSGHTAINTSAPTTGSTSYSWLLNGFHFSKDQPSETHLIVYAANTMTPTAGKLFDNTTTVPGTGNFSTTVLHSPSAYNNLWRFSTAPAGNMVASNGDETLIWGGNEIEATAFITSSASVTYTVTNANDYSDILSNTAQTSDQVATLSASGGNDTYTKVLIHLDGLYGGTTFTDSSASAHSFSASGGAITDTTYKVFGTASLYVDGAGDYISASDSADWSLSNDAFTVDFRVRFETLPGVGDSIGLFGQYEDSSNFWYVTLGRDVTGYFITVHKTVTGTPTTLMTTSSTYLAMAPVGGLQTNTWYHFALIRGWGGSASNWMLTVDGVAAWAATKVDSTTLPNIGGSFSIGMTTDGVSPIYTKGWFDEFRLSKGIARWTAAFTPPTQAYGNSSNTFLIGSKRPLKGVKFYVSSANTVASTMTAKEWQGTAWTTLSATDNTITVSGGSNVTLGQTGTVTWTYTGSAQPRYINGLALYWYQFSFDAGQASLYYVTVDAPIQAIRNIWDGSTNKAVKFQTNVSGTYKEYTDEVGDSVNSTYADLSSLASSDHVLVGFLEPQQAFEINPVTGSENSNASVMTVYFWTGSDWQAVTAMNDGTSSSGKSLNQAGVVSFQAPTKGTEQKRTIADEYPLYYYKFVFSSALDADCKIGEFGGISSPPNLPTFKFSAQFQNRLFLFNENAGAKNKAMYSVADSPDIFNGTDSGELLFGDRTDLTAAAVVYNVFRTTGYEQLLVTKKNETWRLIGDGPSNWELQRMSQNIGCVAPLSMAVCESTDMSEDLRRHVAIWVSDQGVMLSDGATIAPISDDIKVYWDQNDSRYIPTTMQTRSVGWYDAKNRSYKLLIASGSTATWLNTELEYSLKTKEWTKIYRENASGANPLQSGFIVRDANGLAYTYGGGKDGYLYRLENGNNWNSVANITSYIQTKDMILDSGAVPMRKSTVKYLRTLYKQKGTGNITLTHYGDQSASVTGSGGQVSPSAITSASTTLYNTQTVNLGPFLYHSFKASATTNVGDGLELLGIGLYYEPQTTIR